VDHGEFHRYEPGFTIYGVDDLKGLFIVISGSFTVRSKQHGEERVLREITPGRVSGFLPFSKMTTPRGYLVADEPVEFLLIKQDDFRELTRECYEFTGACVQEMLARARAFKSDDKQQEKMAALGRLSAGLAHELNNPESAVARGAGELDAAWLEVAAAARALGEAGLEGEAAAALATLEAALVRTARAPLTPVGRASLEDDCMEWLESRGADPTLAFALVENGITIEDLDGAAAALTPPHLAIVLRYVAAHGAARALSGDLLSAATRIHSLVAAVKKHTHMDRAPATEAVRVPDHIADAVTLLSTKASLKRIALNLTFDEDVPAVVGSVADLNQVWMHLIDNAIDAVGEAGSISVEVARGQGTVVVRVVDDGPGVPPEDQERIFEPFFTTKDVSQGRGFGLDVVRTVVRTHKGSIDLRSKPGRTEFRVTLPAAEGAA